VLQHILDPDGLGAAAGAFSGAGHVASCLRIDSTAASSTAWSSPGLFDVAAALIEQGADVRVVELVVDLPAGAAGADDTQAAQQAQLVRDGRFRQAHDSGQIGNAQLAVRQRVDEADTRRIAEDGERGG
jgi:hypothetical protein